MSAVEWRQARKNIENCFGYWQEQVLQPLDQVQGMLSCSCTAMWAVLLLAHRAEVAGSGARRAAKARLAAALLGGAACVAVVLF